ncbi:MAG: NAD(P)H-hydrate dehydratase, partial [Candidatus Margulisbacteria bacterium]|nr:NAD(P)H-hydrate dehydratase [Candidatus Margulisiibacteriota bacterium]
LLPKRQHDTHKGTYGRVLIIGGSPGMTGAPVMAGKSALRVGAGLVYVGVPESLRNFVDIASLETITLGLPETKTGFLDPRALRYIQKIDRDVIAVGPGLSLQPGIPAIIKGLLQQTSPLVIDADGLNAAALSGIGVLKHKKCDVVLTPHPGEMSRLLEMTADAVQKDRKRLARDLAVKYRITVVLKGRNTIVAGAGGQTYVNKTGNPGMATAGAGDVLSGMLAGLIGQGLPVYKAACLAVFLHGFAGDLAAKKVSEYGLIAGDIIDTIPEALKRFV